MDPDRWKLIRELAEKALNHPKEDLGGFLDQWSDGDEDLRKHVEKLLNEEDGSETLLAPSNLGESLTAGESSGDRISHYRLCERIGEGGFGTVWRAEQIQPVRRSVALKILKLGMDTKQVISRFEAERQALAVMDHPNVAKILDGGTTDGGRPFFVMDLVEGESITEYCDRERLPTGDRLDLFQRVCSAVQHAHQKGIIHRDLKPSNVMVAVENGVAVPKVIDFGIAKALNQKLTEQSFLTEHQQILGTPEYMAPEQAGGLTNDLDTRADIYSMGVLLYELLTGTKPFDLKALLQIGLDEVLRHIREVDPPKPSTRISTVEEKSGEIASLRQIEPRRLGRLLRGDLDWIVMKALDKDRGRRYETAAALGEDIGRFLAGEPIEARAPTAAYRIRKFVLRHRGAVSAAVVVFVSLIAGLFGTTWFLFESKEQESLAKENAKLAEDAEERAVGERDRATQERDRAVEAEKLSESRRLAAEARLILNEDPSLAIALATRAYKTQFSADAYGALFEALSRTREILDVSDVFDVAFSPDGSNWIHGGESPALRSSETGSVLALLEAEGPVRDVEYSRDGQRFFTVESATVHVWDSTTLDRLSHFVARGETHFLDSETLLVVCGKAVSAWRAQSGECRQTWNLPTDLDWILNREAEVFVCYERFEGRVSLLDARTGQSIAALEVPKYPFSPEGLSSRVLLADSEGGYVYLKVSPSDDAGTVPLGVVVNVENGDVAPLSSGSLPSIPFERGLEPPLYAERIHSPDGRLLALGDWNGTLFVFDATNGFLLKHLSGHESQIVDLQWRDSKTLATISWDETVRIWDLDREECLHVLDHAGPHSVPHAFERDRHYGRPSMQEGWRRLVRFTPDGRHVLSLGDNSPKWLARAHGLIQVWDVESGRHRVSLQASEHFRGVEVSPDGSHALTLSEHEGARLWALQEHGLGKNLEIPETKGADESANVVTVSYSPDSTRVLVLWKRWNSAEQSDGGRWQHGMTVFDVETGLERFSHSPIGSSVSDVQWSPDGDIIAMASTQNGLTLWDGWEGTSMDRIPDAESADRGIGFSRIRFLHEDRFIGVGNDGRLYGGEWLDPASLVSSEVDPSKGVPQEIEPISDGQVLVIMESEKDLIFEVWTEHLQPTDFLDFDFASPLSDTFVCSSSNAFGVIAGGFLFTWDTDEWELQASRMASEPMALSSQGNWIAFESGDSIAGEFKNELGSIAVIHGHDGEEIRLLGHTARLSDLAFHPSLPWLVSASVDGTARLWDLSRRRQMTLLSHDGSPMTCATFSPDGRTLLTASESGDVRLWQVDLISMVEEPGFTLKQLERFRLREFEQADPSVIRRLRRIVETQLDLLGVRMRLDREEARSRRAPIPESLRAAAERESREWSLPAGDLNAMAWKAARYAPKEKDEASLRNNATGILRVIEVALARSPNNANYLNTLGALLYRLGRWEEALHVLGCAYAIHSYDDSSDATSAYDLIFMAMCEQRLGHHERAAQTLRAVEKVAGSETDDDLQKILVEARALIEGS